MLIQHTRFLEVFGNKSLFPQTFVCLTSRRRLKTNQYRTRLMGLVMIKPHLFSLKFTLWKRKSILKTYLITYSVSQRQNNYNFDAYISSKTVTSWQQQKLVSCTIETTRSAVIQRVPDSSEGRADLATCSSLFVWYFVFISSHIGGILASFSVSSLSLLALGASEASSSTVASFKRDTHGEFRMECCNIVRLVSMVNAK